MTLGGEGEEVHISKLVVTFVNTNNSLGMKKSESEYFLKNSIII